MNLTILTNMNQRERWVALGGGGLGLLILIWALVVDPSMKGRAELASRIEAKKQEILEVRDIAKRVASAHQRFGALETRMAEPGGPSPLTVVENISRSVGISESVSSMEPQPGAEVEGYKENSVALKIEKIPLGGLVDFLNALGAQKLYIRVKRISIKPLYENPDFLDVSLTLAWYQGK